MITTERPSFSFYAHPISFQTLRRPLAGVTKEELWSLSTLDSFCHKMFYASSISSHLLFICLLHWNWLLSSLQSISLSQWFSTGVILTLGGHLTMSRDSFDCHD